MRYRLLHLPVSGCLLLTLMNGCAPLNRLLGREQGAEISRQQQAVPRPGPVESLFARKGKADDLLIYFQVVQGMSGAQQEKEIEQANLDFSRSGRPEDRMRLALLALLPGRPAAERGQALKLVDDYLADGAREKTSLDALAMVLRQWLTEQRTLQRQLATEKDRGDGLARQLNEQKTQLEELRKQLDELKKIEKILSERERKGLPEKRQ